MTVSSHPLPFPVRDAADLRRAIRYVHKNDSTSLRRYVTARARALGHVDMLPSEWLIPSGDRLASRGSLDAQFDTISARYDISVARLKTVYLRGVKEFQESDIEIGSPSMYGLARVQKFVNATRNNTPLEIDQDLIAGTPVYDVPDTGIEIAVNASAIICDVIYASGLRTAELFEPAIVRSIALDGDLITVSGELDDSPWEYVLDVTSGAHQLHVT